MARAPASLVCPWLGGDIRVRHDDDRLTAYSPRASVIRAAMSLATTPADLQLVLEPGPHVSPRSEEGRILAGAASPRPQNGSTLTDWTSQDTMYRVARVIDNRDHGTSGPARGHFHVRTVAGGPTRAGRPRGAREGVPSAVTRSLADGPEPLRAHEIRLP
jgi:hypothetical protein